MPYDRNRVTDIDLKNSSNTALLEQEYAYDAASNVLTHKKGTVTTSYGYDDVNQVTSESRTGYSASYSYDDNGNRLSKTLGGVTEDYVYDSGDKLTSIKVGTTTVKSFTYDAAGNSKTITHSGGTTYIDYDWENRIEDITRTGVTTNAFSYNGLDTRVSKVDSLGTATFKRAGAGVTAPVIGDGFAAYTPGVSERRGSTTTYAHSGLKSMEARSGALQTILADRQYDAFGQVVSSTGTWSGPFGYAGWFGYQEDGDYGLKLLGHRYYDSSTGRFLTRDPIKDGRNWYGYCGNEPVGFADPAGNARIEVRYRQVALFGDHAFIIIIDEDTGREWRISGGPAYHDDKRQGNLTWNQIQIFAGGYLPDTYDWTTDDLASNLLVDDDLPAKHWIDKASAIGRLIRNSSVRYEWDGPNSNSVAREIIDRLGFQQPQWPAHVWCIGWNHDLWPN